MSIHVHLQQCRRTGCIPLHRLQCGCLEYIQLCAVSILCWKIPASRQSGTGMKKCRCRNQSGTEIWGHRSISQCSHTGLTCHSSECRCRRFRPRQRPHTMHGSRPQLIRLVLYLARVVVSVTLEYLAASTYSPWQGYLQHAAFHFGQVVIFST
jgi:hypothetical protein